MGVSGCGKSTVGAALAAALGVEFVDGDALHSAASVAKMGAGRPLVDDDRWPWLARVRSALRRPSGVVVACSALARRHRDSLRLADGVRFVFLAIDHDEAVQRVRLRTGHFLGSEVVASQFATLEVPSGTETDVVTVAAASPLSEIVERVRVELAQTTSGGRALVSAGGRQAVLTDAALDAHLEVIAHDALGCGARRVLLVPPDHTRLHGRAGDISTRLLRLLEAGGCDVGILPALGTHAALGDVQAGRLFGRAVAADRLLVHDWRSGLRHLGELAATEVEAVTEGRHAEPLAIEVDRQLFDRWDLVISVGQVVPHEVIGMANYTKNVMIGLGGASTIHRTHFVGAMCDLETIMGRAESPVRDLVDAAFDRFVAPLVDVMFVLTVVEDMGDHTVLRGLFAGRGGTGAGGGRAFRDASRLAAAVNVTTVDEPWGRVACWLSPAEMRSTWLGNKAIYRTRMAIADGGELLVLAPGIVRFGEDGEIDRLIRRHGYRGRAATLAAMADDPALRANPAAAAHLIHGSSEGRFRVTYCTDPATGGLTADEVRSVGYGWLPIQEAQAQLGVDGSTSSGARVDAAGEPFTFLRNPAAGLWAGPT
jgi:carbohydrate kinase (thermoresistant glucokinase family)